MSRLNDLIRQVGRTDETLAADLQREVAALADRRAFGLNFERHVPEVVELPGRRVRRGDKVRILPPRGETPRTADEQLWRVTGPADDGTVALQALNDEEQIATAAREDLVVVAEFRDPIYPGLVSTGRVERGGDRPFHTVINAENFHALQALLYTHRAKVDAIYIDPPYNTGAKDWKYNNDYVETDDLYRHSKWLAFMERRLLLANELLNPVDSVLIVTVDEREYLRLGLLLEQTFPNANIQMVTIVTNPAGAGRIAEFSRVDEYLFFVRIGDADVLPQQRDERHRPVTWDTLRRSDIASRRGTIKGGSAQFYPIYVDPQTRRIDSIGDPMPPERPREEAPSRGDSVPVFPIRPDGTEMNWGVTPETAANRLSSGYLRVGRHTPRAPQPYAISYLTGGIVRDIESGKVVVTGRADDDSVVAHYVEGRTVMPTTAWNSPAHDAQRYGTEVLKALIPGRRFPFPKSLYAVEDALRHLIGDRRDAVVVDFFCGSGTTAHAVMRLNREDGGNRQSISVTNNEVSADEQRALRERAMRPGDQEWEALGICEFITKPRIIAAATGTTTAGEPIRGDYKFTDEFPMADGFDENVEFFRLTYEAPLGVASHRVFGRIAPLLWLRAGSRGRRIDDVSAGWDVADAYGVLADLDLVDPFLETLRANDGARIAFIVTDEDRLFETIAHELPDHVEPVRLYESYLRNFEIAAGRGAR